MKLGKPVMTLNVGPTRVDDIEGLDNIEAKAGEVSFVI